MKIREPNILFFGFVLLLSLTPIPIFSNPAPGQDVKISIENGVTVVRNPKKPVPQPRGPSRLVLREDLIIGKEEVPGGYLFAELRSIGVDDEGYIWTLDWEDIKMRVFDNTGKLVSTFGNKGQGPEEWENPNRMIVTPEGTGIVMDLNKLTFYSRDGSCLRELSTARSNFFRFKVDSNGCVYGDDMDLGSKMVLSLTKYDQNLNPIFQVAQAEFPFNVGSLDAFTKLLLCHVTGDDRLVWMVNSDYEFHVLSPEGKPLRRITKDYEARKVTEADRKRIMEDRYGNSPMRSRIVFPDTFPPVYYFIGDAEGRLYVQTYEAHGKDGLWYDVFDEEGRCITRFSLPREEMAFIVKDGKLYVMIQEDEEGRPLVKRYVMEWK